MAEAARGGMGIEVGRSQVRRILLAEGVRWRNTGPWAESAYLRSSSQKPKKIVGLYTDPPPDSTVVCVDELGPVSPRFFPPAPGWSPDGHRIKAPLEYSRGPDKAWVFGALRVEDGKSLTFISRSRNSMNYIKLLKKIERAIPKGIIHVIADNLKTHKSAMVREWLEKHPRIEHAFIPKGGGVAEPHRGVVAAISKTGFGRGGLRRQLRDRPGDEGRHWPVESQSEGVGVGTGTQTAQASEAHFCVPYLRNDAIGTGVKIAVAAAHFHGFGVARQGPLVTWVNNGPRPSGDLQLTSSAPPHLLVSVQEFAECRLLACAIVVHERGHHAGLLP